MCPRSCLLTEVEGSAGLGVQLACHPGDASLNERHISKHDAAPATFLVLGLPDPSLVPRVKAVRHFETPQRSKIFFNLGIILPIKNVWMNQSGEILLVFVILFRNKKLFVLSVKNVTEEGRQSMKLETERVMTKTPSIILGLCSLDNLVCYRDNIIAPIQMSIKI